MRASLSKVFPFDGKLLNGAIRMFSDLEYDIYVVIRGEIVGAVLY